MILSKHNIANINKGAGMEIPGERIFSLPEKIVQFGTGVLLRGLPDYFIDKANKQNIFNGRVVVVKSTGNGGTDTFAAQDGLFTLCVRGIENGQPVEELIINSSISRVLSAKEEWDQVLACAANPNIQVIISNTTEVGISLLADDKVTAVPPTSFPGKLLAFLLHRYQAFGGSKESGMVIIPTELIVDNGNQLKAIVLELAGLNNFTGAFIDWLINANDFCNSLVDRIVPGKLSEPDKKTAEEKCGYTDDLMIMSEVYRLWAIETSDKRSKEILSFSKADEGVIIADNIDIYRELKLRLLNGTHTFSCGMAFLAGFRTVKDGMADEVLSAFITHLMMEEIAPAITYENLSVEEARAFALKVISRFCNPYLEHKWISITMQYSSKMKMRNVPIIQKHYDKSGTVPHRMALGFASYLLFMKSTKNKNGKLVQISDENEYVIDDDNAGRLYDIWNSHHTAAPVVDTVLKDIDLWGIDLSSLPGFSDAVKQNLIQLMQQGVMLTIKNFSIE